VNPAHSSNGRDGHPTSQHACHEVYRERGVTPGIVVSASTAGPTASEGDTSYPYLLAGERAILEDPGILLGVGCRDGAGYR
jgi:hypothetical protein